MITRLWVAVAKGEFGQKLDFSSESVNALDEILVLLSESLDLDLDYESRLWGSYLGEVLRRRYAGTWEMTQYPGGEHAVPAVEVRGSRLFSLMKVYRRITMGAGGSIAAFFALATRRLAQSGPRVLRPSSVNRL